jgi:rubredoxin
MPVYTCPECETKLKRAEPLPSGKKLRCPECGNVFAPAAPIVPTGWGNSLLDALCACVRIIRQFPYEDEATPAAKSAPGA